MGWGASCRQWQRESGELIERPARICLSSGFALVWSLGVWGVGDEASRVDKLADRPAGSGCDAM